MCSTDRLENDESLSPFSKDAIYFQTIHSDASLIQLPYLSSIRIEMQTISWTVLRRYLVLPSTCDWSIKCADFPCNNPVTLVPEQQTCISDVSTAIIVAVAHPSGMLLAQTDAESTCLTLERRVLMQWPDDIEDVGYALHLIPSAITGTSLANVTFVYLHFVSSFATNVCERDWAEFFDGLPKLSDLAVSLTSCLNGSPDVGLPQALAAKEPLYRSPQLRHLELAGFRLGDKIDFYGKCFASRCDAAPLTVLILSNCTPITPDESELLKKYLKVCLSRIGRFLLYLH